MASAIIDLRSSGVSMVRASIEPHARQVAGRGCRYFRRVRKAMHTHAHRPKHPAHDHIDGHAQHHAHAPTTGALRAAFFLNAAFAVLETIGGFWSGSLAVLTDALHDTGDVVVLGAAWWLQRLATRGRDARYSYGYGRYSALGGWLGAGVLIGGALFMLWNAVPALNDPGEPQAAGMMLLAVIGIAFNGFAALRLKHGHSLSERAMYFHLLEDVLGWVAVLVGAVVLYFTQWAWIDPLLSIGISLFILYNAVRTLRLGTDILMQATPTGLDETAVRERLLAIEHVSDVHDQHAWTLDGNYTVVTLHISTVGADQTAMLRVKQQARKVLLAMGVHHATIELEMPGEECGIKE
jgi:cobalt-zinc-cadmium efflux system protein